MAEVTYTNIELDESTFYLIPSTTVPNLSIIELSEEELNRLGEGIDYTVQSYLKIITDETDANNLNWGKNFSIGIFNNFIEENLITIFKSFTFTNSTNIVLIYNIEELNSLFSFDSINIESDVELTYRFADNQYLHITNETLEVTDVDIQFIKDDEVILTVGATLDYEKNNVSFFDNAYDPTDYTSLTQKELFENAQYWSSPVTVLNDFESITCTFPYAPNYPVFLLITGDYPENDPIDNYLSFTMPAVIESELYNGYEEPCNCPYPINSLISDDKGYAELIMTGLYESKPVIFHKMPLDEGFGTNASIAIRGIMITGDVSFTDDLILTAKIKVVNSNHELQIGTRSIVLSNDNIDTSENEMTQNIILGDTYDNWNISLSDLVNLNDMEIEFIFNNLKGHSVTDSSTIQFSNIQIHIYYTNITNANYTVFVEGEDTRYYGMFIETIKIPMGLETDVKYLTVEGTDFNDAINQTITEKTIEIEFYLNDCNLIDSTSQILELAKLFTNERDSFNRPLPKKIEFGHIPGKYAEYIMEDAFDNSIDFAEYEGKLKLVIPAGTFFDIEDTVTAHTGNVNSITKIKPVIQVIPTDDTLEVEETVSGQKFSLGYTDMLSKIIRIDCDNRRVWLLTNEDDTEPVRITGEYIDWNSDWFELQGEYNFNLSGCLLHSVTYKERS